MNLELKLAIIASEMTQRALAKKLGWPEDVISKIIRQVRVARAHEKVALARCLGKPVGELFSRSEKVIHI
jgi:plasmid maintenance system antidote protein VapI